MSVVRLVAAIPGGDAALQALDADPLPVNAAIEANAARLPSPR
jgi:hypothetical protein